MTNKSDLISALEASAKQIHALNLNTTDYAQKEILHEQYNTIRDKIDALLQINITQSTKDYETALASINQINQQITKETQELSKVAGNINKTAKIINTVGKLVTIATAL